jgi:hypothetical protein
MFDSAAAPASPKVPKRRMAAATDKDLQMLAERARPVSTTGSQLLQVLHPLSPLLVDGALRRGSSITVTAGDSGGSISLAMALVSAASSTGSWGALVGTGEPGALAINQLGIDLNRWALIPDPGSNWAETVAKLLDDIDLVVLQPPLNVRPLLARRLVNRTRERRSILIVVRPHREHKQASQRSWWPEPADAHLHIEETHWEGADRGTGYLRRRRMTVVASGRRAATRQVSVDLWLPTPAGSVDGVTVHTVPGSGVTGG